MPGSNWRCGLSTRMRRITSPVRASTLMPENSSWPRSVSGLPAAPMIVTGSSPPPAALRCSDSSCAAGWRTST
ncbi:hypothetical protein G6F32_016015 [Rhizopus arrhizus]|nr:hypothetical protein G6F32_016015 [Rhizopus arrhizus]